jgi:hypothetical protein
MNVGPGMLAVVVGDDADQPKKAKLALLNPQGEVTGSRDFPPSFLPLLGPLPQLPGGGGIVPPGGLPGGGVAIRIRVTQFFDAQTRTLYVLSRKADASADALAAFGPEEVKLVSMPEGWFAASCSANLQAASLELSRSLTLFGTNVAETEFRQQCPALGFLVLDLTAQTVSAIPVPGNGQINVSGQVSDINDFLIAPNATGDTVFVLDGVTLSAFRLDLPPGIASFTNLVPEPSMGIAIGVARVRQPNDAGFVIFDIERAETRVLPIPEGFGQITLAGILPATRKLVARGIRNGNTGSQFLIYDLMTSDLIMPRNPDGVAFVGGLPVQQPGGGVGPGMGGGQPQPAQAQLLRASRKTNAVEAVTYDAERRQTGVMLVRVP